MNLVVVLNFEHLVCVSHLFFRGVERVTRPTLKMGFGRTRIRSHITYQSSRFNKCIHGAYTTEYIVVTECNRVCRDVPSGYCRPIILIAFRNYANKTETQVFRNTKQAEQSLVGTKISYIFPPLKKIYKPKIKTK